MGIILNPIDYFATKFQVGSRNDCWIWNAGRDDRNYGAFQTKLFPNERRAHRIMWLFEHGEIPEDKWVLHHCDDPPCVNPNHLYLGTSRDNVDDRVKRGRGGSFKGKHTWLRRYSDLEVEAMRKMRDEDWTFQAIADQFGCTPSNVLLICRGDVYRG